jgi:hypothetical protein
MTNVRSFVRLPPYVSHVFWCGAGEAGGPIAVLCPCKEVGEVNVSLRPPPLPHTPFLHPTMGMTMVDDLELAGNRVLDFQIRSSRELMACKAAPPEQA